MSEQAEVIAVTPEQLQAIARNAAVSALTILGRAISSTALNQMVFGTGDEDAILSTLQGVYSGIVAEQHKIADLEYWAPVPEDLETWANSSPLSTPEES